MNIYFFVSSFKDLSLWLVLSIITLSHLFRIWKKYLKDTKKYFFTIETQRLKIHVQNIRKKKKNSSCSKIHNKLKYFLALFYNHKCPFNSIERIRPFLFIEWNAPTLDFPDNRRVEEVKEEEHGTVNILIRRL